MRRVIGRNRSSFCWLASCLLPTLLSGPAHAQTERYAVMANGENVGHIIAERKGQSVSIDYAVSDNGRGPKLRESLTLTASGIPSDWSIKGSSLMGGAVDEQMAFKDGVQRWKSQADEGEAKTDSAKLYIANDASPWSLGLYARLVIQAGGRLAVLPSGGLQVREVRAVRADELPGNLKVHAVIVSGVQVTPQFVLLDAHRQLVAVLSDSIVVREGLEKNFQALKDLEESLTFEVLKDMQSKVAHRYSVPIRIRNVHLFDPGSMTTGGLTSLVVYKDRITTVEAEPADAPVPNDEVVIDGAGGTLVPGLHDMHSHNTLWSGPFYLAAGVTTVRDMGNDNVFLQKLMRHIEAQEVPGPNIIPSGFIEGRSPNSARLGFIPDSLAEGLRDVHWYADRGYIQIKIYNSMTPDWVKPLAAEAHGLGLRVVGHVPAFATPDRMIEDGYDEITHINQLMLGWLLSPQEDTRTPLRLTAMARAADLDISSPRVRHTVELMKAHHTGLDTTAVILERLMMSRAGQVEEGDAPYLSHMPIGYQRYRKRSFVTFKDAEDERRYRQAFAKVLETLTMLHREGIALWPGTDDATGFTVHRELELYAKLGMPPAEVLKIATLDCDQYMKRDQGFGSLSRGKRADFFLVSGDPAADISAVRNVRMVVKEGTLYYPQELYSELGIVPFQPAPAVVGAAPAGH